MTKPKLDDLLYVDNKFAGALETMAESELPLRQRVFEAWESHLTAIDEHDFPEDVRAQYVALMARMTWAENAGRGTIAATLSAVSDDEVRKLARLVTEIACGLRYEVQHRVAEEARADVRRQARAAKKRGKR